VDCAASSDGPPGVTKRRWGTGLVAAMLVASAFAVAAARGDGVRTVHIRIHYSRFDATSLSFAPGETVRFVVENTDPIDHEFILGDRTVQILHERGTQAVHAPRPGVMTVPANTTRTTTFTFGDSGPLVIGCHLPGHYAFGMRIAVTVA
jgi:uncharacterized cupredoxin-like copper-binding protein